MFSVQQELWVGVQAGSGAPKLQVAEEWLPAGGDYSVALLLLCQAGPLAARQGNHRAGCEGTPPGQTRGRRRPVGAAEGGASSKASFP